MAELPLDREDVVTIMGARFDLNWKLDLILELLLEDDEEEET
jgi:hypothetical protein